MKRRRAGRMRQERRAVDCVDSAVAVLIFWHLSPLLNSSPLPTISPSARRGERSSDRRGRCRRQVASVAPTLVLLYPSRVPHVAAGPSVGVLVGQCSGGKGAAGRRHKADGALHLRETAKDGTIRVEHTDPVSKHKYRREASRRGLSKDESRAKRAGRKDKGCIHPRRMPR